METCASPAAGRLLDLVGGFQVLVDDRPQLARVPGVVVDVGDRHAILVEDVLARLG